jgi:acyl carrier protein
MTVPDPKDVLGELTTLLRRLCEHDDMELTADTWIDDIPGIDSLRLLQAVAHLEEHFHVEVDVAALTGLNRVQDILDAISRARPLGN